MQERLERYERWFKTLDDQIRILDRERQKFAAIANQGDTCTFVADASCTVRWTNRAMTQRLPPDAGRSSWVGSTCSDLCQRLNSTSCLAGGYECPVAAALDRTVTCHRELRYAAHDGVRHLYMSALPISGPDGRAGEVLVMIQDLTDLEILRRSESRYRLLFDRSTNGIVMADPHTHRIVLANEMATHTFGYTAEEFQTLSLQHLHPPDEWDAQSVQYGCGAEQRAALENECTLLTKDGRPRLATVTTSRFDLEGRPVVMAEFRDITDRKQMEEALARTEQRLEAVIANAPICLFATDRDGVFTLSTGAGLKALGKVPGQSVGQSVFDLYADVPDVLDNVRRTLAGEECTATLNIRSVIFEVCFRPLRSVGGEVTGLIGVGIDVTESKHLEEQLRQAQKMDAIGRLAGGIAHDFNNLLTIILGHSELLANRLGTSHPQRRDALEIHRAGVRGAWLTRQLLAFSRKDVATPRLLDVGVVATEMEKMLRRLIGEHIQLETRVRTTDACILADQGQIEQVIMNLAVNARDAMAEGGRLRIDVRDAECEQEALESAGATQGPFVLLTVSDTGCGMDPEARLHAFEPFFTTKGRGKGTGLGLSIVYGIVQQSGGHIAIDSEPGRGTRVHVFLPRVGHAAGAASQEGDGPALARGEETILLVEDEDRVRALARDILETLGYRVLEAPNGATALRVLEECGDAIHLLLTDVVMPGMSGGELAQRAVALCPEMRSLYMSGYTDDAAVRHGVLDANAPFLHKPFTLESLTRAVREALDAPRKAA
jgi:PAS domain S-box-containing protein